MTVPIYACRLTGELHTDVPPAEADKYMVSYVDEAVRDRALRRQFSELVGAERDRRESRGTTITLDDGMSIPLRGRPKDQSDLTALGIAAQGRIAAGDVTPFEYRDRDNVIRALTPAQMQELFAKGVAWVTAVRKASWGIKDAYPGHDDDWRDDHHWPDGD